MNKYLKASFVILMIFLSVTLVTSVSISVYEPSTEVAVIKAGSNSSDVKLVQKKLKNWGYYSGSIDGIYGSKTRSAVRLFQRRNGLAVDGIVGNKTLAALGISQSMLSGDYEAYAGANQKSPPCASRDHRSVNRENHMRQARTWRCKSPRRGMAL